MTLLRTELPYREDSAAMFEAVADLAWAVFLDSGRHHLTQSRYDIIAAEPPPSGWTGWPDSFPLAIR